MLPSNDGSSMTPLSTDAVPGPSGPATVTPPGDLPPAQIAERRAAQRRQFRHDNTIVPLMPRSDESVEIWATSGAAVRLGRAVVMYTTDGSQPTPPGPVSSDPPTTSAVAAPMESAAVEWDEQAGYLTRWRATLPPRPAGTMVRYRIAGWHPDDTISSGSSSRSTAPDLWAQDGQGFHFRLQADGGGVTTFAYLVSDPLGGLPDWALDATIYHIFLDRFHPGTPDGAFAANSNPRQRHGGTLRGVLQALPYLHDLGINCLWLSPISLSETYHRYDALDLAAIDPAAGADDDLAALCDTAHGLGMHILLDFAPSHCSWRHPAFLAAQRDLHAPTASWFTFYDWPHSYRNFLDVVPTLPSFNTSDPGARAYLVGAAVHWLRRGIDGFRLDHAIGPSMDFWCAFRVATRAVAPDSFTVGEVTDTPDCLRRYGGRLDGVLDFPLARALLLTFGTSVWTVGDLDGFLAAHERYMAVGPSRVSFLDNHDMNRFLFVAGNDPRRLQLAALCQFTLEAVPAIYYGTEIGMSQQQDIAVAGDAEARADMPWDRSTWNRPLHAFYRALVHLRRDHAALRRGARETVHLDVEQGTYAYVRRAPRQGVTSGDMCTAFNVSPHERTITLASSTAAAGPFSSLVPRSVEAPRWGGRAFAPGTCLLYSGSAPRLNLEAGRAEITLAPLSGIVLG